MRILYLVGLRQLMELTSGRPEVTVGIIDGPIALDHPDLSGAKIREVPGKLPFSCSWRESVACVHGTFVMGMLAASRESAAPAICPGCTFLVRPIFSEISANADLPNATPNDLAEAIIDLVNAGALVVNLSVGLVGPSSTNDERLKQALTYAASRGVIPVVAAGNQGTIGSSAMTRHPWVLPVVGCDREGRPMDHCNLAASFGRRGVCAPGERITSLGTNGKPLTMDGTSAATPFVTGAIALLWSQFPEATASDVKLAVARGSSRGRPSLVPPLLDAWAAHGAMMTGVRLAAVH
jgi:subtilisin family serine protease